jgi:ABC-2 type transport system permease protein
MKYAFLIALREYVENAKTKGFWIGIFFIPLLLWGGIEVPRVLQEKAAPVRYFVLVDQSQQFEAAIDAALERYQERRVRQSMNEYLAKHAKPDTRAKIDLEKIPLPDGVGEDSLESDTESNPAASRQRIDSMLAQAKTGLRADAAPFVEPRRDYQRIPLPSQVQSNSPLAVISEELKPYLRGGRKLEHAGQRVQLHAAILIPSDIQSKIKTGSQGPGLVRPEGIEYWSGNLAEMTLRNTVERGVNAEVRKRELKSLGVNPATVEKAIQSRVPIVDLSPKKEKGKETVSMADRIRQWAPTAFVYLLWLSIFSIIQMLLNNTIEEKSNRLIEVLLSSVTASELMMGKLLGIAATGLTLVGTWVFAIVGILWFKAGPESEMANQALGVLRTSNLVPAFVIYFLLGFLLYAGLILALGSVCNTLKEAQSYMAFITMLMMVPLLTMAFIPQDPNGRLATVLSWIPIYTPFVMLNRAAADPPMFDLIGTTLLLLLTTALVLWSSGKIFRIGILRTGQPPKFLELLRWLKRQ